MILGITLWHCLGIHKLDAIMIFSKGSLYCSCAYKHWIMLGIKSFGQMSQECGHISLPLVDVFFILQILIDHLFTWHSPRDWEHILDILGCSVLDKQLGFISSSLLFQKLCSCHSLGNGSCHLASLAVAGQIVMNEYWATTHNVRLNLKR